MRQKEKKEGIMRENISEAGSFDELFTVLREISGLEGSQKYYSSDELIELIQKVRTGKLPLGYITRAAGLRGKMEQLLEVEKAEKLLRD